MTDLSALKEKVKRYAEHPYPKRSERGWDYLNDASDIADALLSKEPITRTALEELGFEWDGPIQTLQCNGFSVTAALDAPDQFLWRPDNSPRHREFEPQPKHVGALLSLLLWLEEQK